MKIRYLHHSKTTADIVGCYYTAANGSHMAFWTYLADRVSKGTLQGGRCKAGTRTIHAFGGQRVKSI